MTTQQRHVCRQLGTLAGSLDYWVAETRRREADLAGLRGVPYRRAAMAFQEAVRAQQRAITDLRDGAAHDLDGSRELPPIAGLPADRPMQLVWGTVLYTQS